MIWLYGHEARAVQPQDICTLVGQELHLVDPREHQDSCEGKRWLEPKAALEAVPLLHELVFLEWDGARCLWQLCVGHVNF